MVHETKKILLKTNRKNLDFLKKNQRKKTCEEENTIAMNSVM